MKLFKIFSILICLCCSFKSIAEKTSFWEYIFICDKVDSLYLNRLLKESNLPLLQFNGSNGGYNLIHDSANVGYYNFGLGFSSLNFNSNRKKSIQTQIPRTFLKFSVANNKDQYFVVNHFNNLSKKAFLYFDFERLRSIGNYNRQANNISNGDIRLFLKNTKTSHVLGFSFIRVDNQLSGGYDLIDSSIVSDPNNFAEKLSFANYKLWNNNFYFDNSFNIISPDSLSQNKVSFILDFKASNSSYLYNELNPNFLDNEIFIDSTQTNDSIRFEQFGFKSGFVFKGKRFTTDAGFEFNKGFLNINENRFHPNIGLLNFGAAFNFWNLKIGTRLNYSILGYNKSDSDYKLYLTNSDSSKNFMFNIFVSNQNRTPNLLYSNYFSNYYKWDNNLLKEKYLNFGGKLHLKSLGLCIEGVYSKINNYSFIDTNVAVLQAGNIDFVQIKLKHRYRIWRFHFDNLIVYQNSQSALRLPEWVLKNRLAFSNKVFKNKLFLEFGVENTYFSEFYINDFVPSLGAFKIQNSRKFGNYPILDIFLIMKIRRFNITASLDHFNYGMNGKDVFLMPNYPVKPRIIRLGFIWEFYN